MILQFTEPMSCKLPIRPEVLRNKAHRSRLLWKVASNYKTGSQRLGLWFDLTNSLIFVYSRNHVHHKALGLSFSFSEVNSKILIDFCIRACSLWITVNDCQILIQWPYWVEPEGGEGLYPENKKGRRFISGEQGRKKVNIRRTNKEKGLYPDIKEGRRFISGEQGRNKVNIYPENKKGKMFISEEQERKKVYIRRTRKEEGLYLENKEGRRFISGEQERKKVYIQKTRKKV